jgi:hypothetical protein
LPELDLNELSVLRFAQNGATSANSIPAHHMKTKGWSDELKTGKLLNASAGAFFDLAWTEWENANDKGLHAGLIWAANPCLVLAQVDQATIQWDSYSGSQPGGGR